MMRNRSKVSNELAEREQKRENRKYVVFNLARSYSLVVSIPYIANIDADKKSLYYILYTWH